MKTQRSTKIPKDFLKWLGVYCFHYVILSFCDWFFLCFLWLKEISDEAVSGM